MAKAYRYKAFISYSHSDRLPAARLLRSLENFRVPRRLRTEGQGASVPVRVGTLFRDRDELPAAEDLTAEVRKALSESEFMIVLCSPSAAASRWVNREIIEFKKLNGEGRLLSVILSGEPFATDKGAPADECFPPALRFRLSRDGRLTSQPAEPLAADFRASGDGYRRGILKLVAGLLGIGLDTLMERDLQRRMRRVTAVTAASLFAVLVMGALTYEAVTARQDADRHRSEAEGLIEFMLTDLKDKLEPVGRLDVLDAVGEEAVAYYDRQPIAGMPTDALGRRARAFQLLGEIANLKGDLHAAQDMFEQAAASTEGLLMREPDNSQRIFEHSQSVYWVGYQDWQRGNFEKAEAAFRAYKALADQLVAADPANPDWQLEAAYASSNLGTLLLEQLARPEDALVNFEAALDQFSRISAGAPGDTSVQLDLADAHGWVGETLAIVGPLTEARAHREAQIALLAGVEVANPRNASVITEQLAAHVPLGVIEAELGNMDKARAHLEKAVALGRRLHALEPDNARWSMSLAVASMDLADLLLTQDDMAGATGYLAFARTYVAGLDAGVTESNRYRYGIVLSADILEARLALRQGDMQRAAEALARPLALIAAELPQIMAWKNGPYMVAAAYGTAADLYPDQGQTYDDRLIAGFTPLVPHLDSRSLALLVAACQRAGHTADAEAAGVRLAALKRAAAVAPQNPTSTSP